MESFYICSDMVLQERFQMDADTYEQALHYFKNRAIQLKRFGITFKNYEDIGFGLKVDIEYIDYVKPFISVYVYKSYRNKGLYKPYIIASGKTVLVIEDCGISGYLNKNKIVYEEIESPSERYAYRLISNIYKDIRTKRSGIYLMNHIDEGLYILNKIGVSVITKDAYCLHPILQSDESLSENYLSDKLLVNPFNDFEIHPSAFILAMEYRRVANNYLSQRNISNINDIELSILPEVNQMLISDKIQNRKDFEMYHIDTNPRTNELQKYFKNWFSRLGVSEELYQSFKQELSNE
jgi:hypothetical protein